MMEAMWQLGGGGIADDPVPHSLEGLQVPVRGWRLSPSVPWGAGAVVHGWRGPGLQMAPSAPALGEMRGQLLPGSPAR